MLQHIELDTPAAGRDPAPPRRTRASFTTPEGLRALLIRLHEAGDRSWRHDREAAQLMSHTAHRYRGLAAKHGMDKWDAAAIAFEAMLTPAVRNAGDPWAAVTRAVQWRMIHEARANALLCSTVDARKLRHAGLLPVHRFSDQEVSVAEYRPEFRVPPPDIDDSSDVEAAPADQAVAEAVHVLTLLGWPEPTAAAALDYICSRVTQTPTKATAADVLLRDKNACSVLDLPAESWNALLRVVLGNMSPDFQNTSASRGILARLLVGEPVESLFEDDDLVLAISLSAPTVRGRR